MQWYSHVGTSHYKTDRKKMSDFRREAEGEFIHRLRPPLPCMLEPQSRHLSLACWLIPSTCRRWRNKVGREFQQQRSTTATLTETSPQNITSNYRKSFAIFPSRSRRTTLNLASSYLKKPRRFIRFSDFDACHSFVAVAKFVFSIHTCFFPLISWPALRACAINQREIRSP